MSAAAQPAEAAHSADAAQPAEARPPRRIALELAGARVEVPARGMVVGRELAPWRDLAAMRALTQVSRKSQARLFWQGRTLYVVDAGSRNGTFVDGARVDEAVPLRPGTSLRFGLDVSVGVVELDEHGMAIGQE